MAQAKRQEAEMETTESYRGPLREVSNAERLLTPDNDNRPKSKRSDTVTNTSARGTRTRLKKMVVSQAGNAGPTIAKGINIVSAALVLQTILWAVALLYPIQLTFGLLNFLGLASLIGIEETLLDYVDIFDIGAGTFEILFYGSTVVLFFLGLIILTLALMLFWWRQVPAGGGVSLVVAAICLCLYTIPVFNLVPWILLWCLYVVKSQTKS